jgi:hypothetical protein
LNTAEETAKAPGAVQQKNRTPALPPAPNRWTHDHFPRTATTLGRRRGSFLLDSAQAEPNSEGLFNDRRLVPAVSPTGGDPAQSL